MKNPAEKNFIAHLLWLKNKLENGVIKQLTWTDTRDMTADGHTKGSIKRTAIHNLMNGSLTVQHKRESLTLYNPRAQLTQAKADRHEVSFVHPVSPAVHVVNLSFAMSHATAAASSSSNRPRPTPTSVDDPDSSSNEAPAAAAARLKSTEDPWKILGWNLIDKQAAVRLHPSDVKKRFRKLARKHHPDKFSNPEAKQIADDHMKKAECSIQHSVCAGSRSSNRCSR